MKIKIQNDQRVIFVGTTGSGKTVLAKHLLTRLHRVFVIDPKHTFKLDGFSIRRTLPMLGSKFRVIFRPRLGDDETLAGILQSIQRKKHATIYCDELATLAEQFPRSTLILADIARTGREKHVSVWNVVQRPRWVPRVFFTEAEIIFMFKLRSEDDRKYTSQFIGEVAQNVIEKFQFWYSHVDDLDPALMTYNIPKNYIEKIG